jgi:hypothetical protein
MRARHETAGTPIQRQGVGAHGAASCQMICVKINEVYLAGRIVLFSPDSAFDGVNPRIEGFHLGCRAGVRIRRKRAFDHGKYGAIRAFSVSFSMLHLMFYLT